MESDIVATRAYANTERPPASFYELQRNSVRAVRLAIRDGHSLLEIEFPPLPASVLEMEDVSAYDVAQANLRLATEFAQSYVNSCTTSSSSSSSTSATTTTTTTTTMKPPLVAVLLPDEAELDIGLESTGLSKNPHPGVIISALRRQPQPDYDEDGDKDTKRTSKPMSLWSWFGKSGSGVVRPIEGVSMYICIIASAQELPDIEELYNNINHNNHNTTILCYNLKLDVLRGDLGAPAFPPKAFQDRFLSKVKPVYYLRTRQYSRSTSQPPFLVNYQGCLFRSYPGQYQTLLDTGTGSYRRVSGSDIRPSLGEFKEQLTQALRDQGVLAEESSTLNFLRTGYKTTTWWEEDRPDASNDWKT
jgi:hypothetical protein